MNNNLFKPLIITAGVILLIGAAFLIFTLVSPEQSPDDEQSVSPATVYVTQSDKSDIAKLDFSPAGSPGYTIDISSESGSSVYTVSPSADGFGYNSTSIVYILNYFSSLPAVSVISEQPTAQELSEFGFDAPLGEVTGTFSDGTAITLTVGNMTATKDTYYVRSSESDAVYIISESYGNRLLSTEMSLRTLTIFPYEDEENPSENVQYVRVEQGGDVISLNRYSDEEIEEIGYGVSTFGMQEPGNYFTNEYQSVDNYIVPLLQIGFSGAVADSPANLAQYGLDDPDVLEMTDKDGITYTLYLGDLAGNNERYAMKGGIDCVILVPNEDLTFLALTKMDLVSPTVWIYNIDSLTGVEFDLNGQRHVLDINSDFDNDIFEASLDGGEITEDNARRLYLRTISMYVDKEIEPGQTYGAPEYTIRINLRDGTQKVLELCPVNVRQYAVVLNGQPAEFTVNITDIEALEEGFALNAQGEEIPQL